MTDPDASAPSSPSLRALTARFEAARPRLGALAYRMLGSFEDAQDAVQEAWLRLRGSSGETIANPDAWLTTVVARICLNMLRERRTHGGEELSARLPDPIVEADEEFDPEHRAMLADAVGLALFVVLDTLPPAERLAFVLHDVFSVPFDQIATIVDRTPESARKLASRARRRIERADPVPDGDLAAQREVVDAFFAAGRSGDFERLVSVLHPEVVLRGDFGPAAAAFRADGAASVARLARSYAGPDREVRAATVNGAAGAVIFVAGRAASVMGFVVRGGRIRAIDVLADPARIAKLGLRPPGADH
ncbi:sigma-70 family RNA polymerase sigma factor [Mycobacterium intracellulare]|uniref:Sigma-70 family RNA polymerase sigma factor n=1 Tax=Mycobacterium intracellulare TaxID=1767 RepID=A0AAE4R8G6_MYCIT|nr:sigma-70 family RNA polymerase sigma factor [Mycobacterium intracellulare]MCA2318704.1 sigma-70 family RNA polymerase sigma factor [Mycobacterium intracellulare]MCA2338991.1 sigma-70 family RNA polymerase sigma factor [Mycobacterium intracellulare]MDV6975447.1 sigma-70 family RNA polymerase sigma factor [Mycobacterium intracellulare]MDV6980511.1 sigma-70 family RNA polymerase sigma factor [Mycobacterium intracellulare]MDV7010940.1 sigma-70 family RNA polymerase sigma factor [Mycobacterium i